MLKINVPNTPWSEQAVTLNGVEYRFIFSYNERNERWYLTIYLADVLVIAGLSLMENGFMLLKYNLDLFNHGDLFCVRIKKTSENATYGNVGFGKEYELIYLSNQELIDIFG